MVYSEEMLNEFYNAENTGVIKGASSVGKVTDNETGSIMKIYLLTDGEVVKEATFQTFGSVAAIACCGRATKLLLNKSLDEIEKTVNAKLIIKELSLDARWQKYAVMAEKTVKAALKNHVKKNK